MNVNDSFAADNVRVGFGPGNTGSLTVTGGPVDIGNGTEDFDIGVRTSGSSVASGDVDFSAAGNVDIDVANIRVAVQNSRFGCRCHWRSHL